MKYNHEHYYSLDNDVDTLRKLMNITLPINLSTEYYKNQDLILSKILREKGIVNIENLEKISPKIILYYGDITLLKVDTIVNACNEKLLGCFVPLHSCIDNAIHSAAGLQVRRDLLDIMNNQGHDEPNGQCKVTKGYNLPSKYIFHTVGPKVYNDVTLQNKKDLESCYLSCLKKANEMNLNSIAFCSISTGIYGYPQELAADIAIKTVYDYLKENPNTSINKVIFDVFSRKAHQIYEERIRKINK
jgi:O-acetyl-ADP-ribose deacetylase (regulator of RNase III)